MKARALACVLLSVALIGTACGARLTTAQRNAGIGSLVQDQGNNQAAGPQATGSAQPGSGPIGSSGPFIGPSATGSAAASLPPGGNGGATALGVTATTITLSTASDVSGVQPGIFKSSWQAMQALAQYVNSTGGIYGRQIKNLLLDSKADSVANRAAVTQACDQSFALVGSMSAFDDGGASVGQQCGIPDVSAITVNHARTMATNVYPASPNRPDLFNTSWGMYIKSKYPEAIKHAAILWLNAGAPIQNGRQRMHALTNLGFNFVYQAETQVLEANYGPYVQAMKNKGVQFVTMVSDYQSIVRLEKAMEEQSWFPAVRVWDSVAYSQNFLNQAGTSGNGALVFINTAMFEEATSNPELQLYETWLQRVAPGAVPDYFGVYAWSAGRLFLKAALAAGPHLTRAALFEQLKLIHSWDDFGMHVTQDIGSKREANCIMYMEIRNQHFARIDPSSGWRCQGSLMRVS
jgi:ABC-type branched-subunit amino acid transport system substrate-binding protein